MSPGLLLQVSGDDYGIYSDHTYTQIVRTVTNAHIYIKRVIHTLWLVQCSSRTPTELLCCASHTTAVLPRAEKVPQLQARGALQMKCCLQNLSFGVVTGTVAENVLYVFPSITCGARG